MLIVIEPINHRDMPGYFLNTSGQGAAVIDAVGRTGWRCCSTSTTRRPPRGI
ncbi:MAG: hypothetical protein WDN49_18920 [Acetobacteraceae bacterium]